MPRRRLPAKLFKFLFGRLERIPAHHYNKLQLRLNSSLGDWSALGFQGEEGGNDSLNSSLGDWSDNASLIPSFQFM